MANTANRRPCCIRLVLPLLLLAQQGLALASDWKITPRLSLEERYTDNLNLRREGQERSDWITEISPGVSVQREGRKLKVDADYSLQGLIYANDSDRSKVRHNLNGRANAEMLEDWFFLDAKARISQELLSYAEGGGLGDAVGIGNTTQVASYSLSPYLKHRFGSAATVEARLGYDGTLSGSDALSDSTATHYKLNASSGTDFHPFSWGVSYDKRETDNESIADTDSERASANARLLLRPGLGLIAQAGMEKGNFPGASNRVRDFSYYGLGAFYSSGRRFSMDAVYNLSDSGNFVSGSVAFRPTLRTTIDASSTVRNFGRSHGFSFNHRTRKSNWTLSYSESLTSFSESLSKPLGAAWLCNFNSKLAAIPFPVDHIYTEEETSFLAENCREFSEKEIEEVYGRNPTLPFASNETHVSQVLIASLSYELRRGNILISLFDNQREFQARGNSDKNVGLRTLLSLRPGARTTYTLTGGLSRVEDSDTGREDDLWHLGMTVTRKFQPDLTGSVEVRHQQRESNLAGGDYAENSVAARLNMRF